MRYSAEESAFIRVDVINAKLEVTNHIKVLRLAPVFYTGQNFFRAQYLEASAHQIATQLLNSGGAIHRTLFGNHALRLEPSHIFTARIEKNWFSGLFFIWNERRFMSKIHSKNILRSCDSFFVAK